MHYNRNNSIPAFGGIASSNPSNTIKMDHQGLFNIYESKTLKLVSNRVKDLDHNYVIGSKRLLWTGGYKLPVSELADFNPHTYQHKFVFLKFDDHGIELFTDHFSKIPLFICKQGDSLLFATSLQLLMTLKATSEFKVDDFGLLFYYNFGFSNYKNYLIADIESIPGGKQVTYTFDKSELQQQSYYDIFNVERYSNSGHSLDENVKLIDQELLRATKNTVDHFDTIGIALSGGVDSGYLAQKINEVGRDFYAYTLGFKDDYNEFDRIDYLSEKLNFKAKKIIIDTEEIIDNYLDVSSASSFPISFNNSILNIIYKQASDDGVGLMFDGDGADRLFLGMNKYVQLQKILNLYNTSKSLKSHRILVNIFNLIPHPSFQKMGFYFKRFNENYPFYGERKLPNNTKYDPEFERLLNDLALPEELKQLAGSIDDWLFFSLFSVFYTPAFFFHTPYELQLKHNISSNPQFWSDGMVDLALGIPVDQKLDNSTTKKVLREAAKLKIDDGYWNLTKIGLQNSYQYIQQNAVGKDFVNSYVEMIKQTNDYYYLKEHLPEKSVDAERLLPFFIWKQKLKESI